MNVVFHAIGGAAIAAAMYRGVGGGGVSSVRVGWMCAGAFLLGVVAHGVMDVLPHQYPFRAAMDITLAMVFFFVFAFLIRRDAIPFFFFSYLGSMFPDLLDLGPQMLNQFAGTALPVSKTKVFFWHRPEYSGSIYDGSQAGLSFFLHALVVGVSTLAIVFCRRIFKNRLIAQG